MPAVRIPLAGSIARHAVERAVALHAVNDPLSGRSPECLGVGIAQRAQRAGGGIVAREQRGVVGSAVVVGCARRGVVECVDGVWLDVVLARGVAGAVGRVFLLGEQVEWAVRHVAGVFGAEGGGAAAVAAGCGVGVGVAEGFAAWGGGGGWGGVGVAVGGGAAQGGAAGDAAVGWGVEAFAVGVGLAEAVGGAAD